MADLCAGLGAGAGHLVWKEDPRGHAGEDHDPEGQQLQVSGQDATALDVGHVLGGEGALHDDLKSFKHWILHSCCRCFFLIE